MCSCILSAGILSPVIGEMRKDSCGGAACDCLAGMGEEGGGGGREGGGRREEEGGGREEWIEMQGGKQWWMKEMDRERHGARAMDRRYIYGYAACYHGDAIHQLNGTFGIVVLSDECGTIVWCDNHRWLRGGRGSRCGLLKVTRSGLSVVCFRHTNTFIAQQTVIVQNPLMRPTCWFSNNPTCLLIGARNIGLCMLYIASFTMYAVGTKWLKG